MNEAQLRELIRERYPRENAECEWKGYSNLRHAFSGHAGDDIASYSSALANGEGGHLVIGVEDNTLNILGIREFGDFTADSLSARLAGSCSHLNTEGLWVEVYVTADTGKTVWVLHVPKHQPRLPVYAHGKAYQRVGDSLMPIRPERLEAILRETVAGEDWSAGIVPGATIDSLDQEAISLARQMFKEKNSRQAGVVDNWSDSAFLDKAKITVDGAVTRSALLLLGREEAVHLLSPAPAQITWKLASSQEQGYEHFGPPFLLTTSEVLRRIRNVRTKIFPANQLLPTELLKYEPRVILEALHNCIAHQDYTRNERILVTEKADRIIFENAGSFFEGSYSDYVGGEHTPTRYRNTWLSQAMVNLNMIDTMGYGIHQMFLQQRKRFFPLPDYSRTTESRVILEVFGQVIDENYSRLLMERSDLSFGTVVLLDRVQKKQAIGEQEALDLRKMGLVEGRRPHLVVSAKVADATDTRAEYTRNKGLDDQHYKELVISHLRKFKQATREELEKVLLDKLPDVLDEKQKRNKIKNLLTDLRVKENRVQASRRGPGAVWTLRT